MQAIDLSAATWRKSSYSNPDGGQCVEVCKDFEGILAVRDSKSPSATLVFPAERWVAFVSALKTVRRIA